MQSGLEKEHDFRLQTVLKFKVSFFIEDRYLGEGVYECKRTGSAGEPRSKAWFCWRCGRIWARAIADDSKTWSVFKSLCGGCKYSEQGHSAATLHMPSGSIWPEYEVGQELDFIASMPYEVVKEQFNRHVEWLKQKGGLI